MTFQHKDMGGFRQLELSELERVSAGGSYDFKALDVNSDGVITQAEMAASDWSDDAFSDADTNQDGVLSAAEMANLIVVTAKPWWYDLTSGLGGGYSGGGCRR